MTLRWEALLWSIIAVTAPGAVHLLRRRFSPQLPEWAHPIEDGAGWLHGLILPYIALITGSIPGGLAGLYAIKSIEWVSGGLACGFGLLAVYVFHRIRPRNNALLHRSALARWQDEPRWALYRAAGALWLQDVTLGAGLGLLLSGLEWLVTGWSREPHGLASRDREPLYRSAISTILFILTRNFWLTAGTQLIFFLILESWSSSGKVEAASAEQ